MTRWRLPRRQEIEHKKKIFLTDKKVVLTQNEQLDGFPIGEKNLRRLAFENGGLEGSRATVHEKARPLEL